MQMFISAITSVFGIFRRENPSPLVHVDVDSSIASSIDSSEIPFVHPSFRKRYPLNTPGNHNERSQRSIKTRTSVVRIARPWFTQTRRYSPRVLDQSLEGETVRTIVQQEAPLVNGGAGVGDIRKPNAAHALNRRKRNAEFLNPCSAATKKMRVKASECLITARAYHNEKCLLRKPKHGSFQQGNLPFKPYGPGDCGTVPKNTFGSEIKPQDKSIATVCDPQMQVAAAQQHNIESMPSRNDDNPTQEAKISTFPFTAAEYRSTGHSPCLAILTGNHCPDEKPPMRTTDRDEEKHADEDMVIFTEPPNTPKPKRKRDAAGHTIEQCKRRRETDRLEGVKTPNEKRNRGEKQRDKMPNSEKGGKCSSLMNDVQLYPKRETRPHFRASLIQTRDDQKPLEEKMGRFVQSCTQRDCDTGARNFHRAQRSKSVDRQRSNASLREALNPKDLSTPAAGKCSQKRKDWPSAQDGKGKDRLGGVDQWRNFGGGSRQHSQELDEPQSRATEKTNQNRRRHGREEGRQRICISESTKDCDREKSREPGVCNIEPNGNERGEHGREGNRFNNARSDHGREDRERGRFDNKPNSNYSHRENGREGGRLNEGRHDYGREKHQERVHAMNEPNGNYRQQNGRDRGRINNGRGDHNREDRERGRFDNKPNSNYSHGENGREGGRINEKGNDYGREERQERGYVRNELWTGHSRKTGQKRGYRNNESSDQYGDRPRGRRGRGGHRNRHSRVGHYDHNNGYHGPHRSF